MDLTMVASLQSCTQMLTSSECMDESVYREVSAQPYRRESSPLGCYASFRGQILR